VIDIIGLVHGNWLMPEIKQESGRSTSDHPARPRWAGETWLKIARVTMRDSILRFGGHLALLVVIALGIWAARVGFDTLPVDAALYVEPNVGTPQPTVTAIPISDLENLPPYSGGPTTFEGISRAADVHTVFPTRPRLKIVKYVVQQGDTLFGIAERFGLEPETVLWGNFDVLEDDPHRLSPGQEINIPPVDGTTHVWHEGDGLNGIAEFFGVTVEDILDWPGNNLDSGIDVTNPPLEPGESLMIPGGTRAIVTWSAPRIYRSNPAAARIYGPGYCGNVVDGPVGAGVFIWPTPLHYLSGYHYSSIHPAIDIAGEIGHSIYASDAGVVVYSGWNNYGYGYVVVLDHGNGWQTLYAHLSQVNMVCGQAVFQGNVIGLMGVSGNSSGAHLHFEMMHDTFGKVNPSNFLP
jgi:murein DD-endopeptidase MepM/ murein hydrolase activator NlpD